MRTTSELLAAYPHFSVRTREAFEAAINRVYRDARVISATGSRQFLATSNRRAISQTSLAYATTSNAIEIQIPEIESYGLLLAWGGGARVAGCHGGDFDITAKRAFVASPGQSFGLKYAAQFEHLVLGIQPQFLISKLSALADKPVHKRPTFTSAADLNSPASRRLHRTIALLLDQLQEPGFIPQPLALLESEQTAILSLLCAIDHDHAHLLQSKILTPGFWQLHRAEDYIEANWDKPLTIETLAAVTEVSVRSLFYAFSKFRGCSPMEFVRRVRLSHARRRLLDPDPNTSITTTALDCGFGNLGHFSKYYCRQFGELPSATLKRKRSMSVT